MAVRLKNLDIVPGDNLKVKIGDAEFLLEVTEQGRQFITGPVGTYEEVFEVDEKGWLQSSRVERDLARRARGARTRKQVEPQAGAPASEPAQVIEEHTDREPEQIAEDVRATVPPIAEPEVKAPDPVVPPRIVAPQPATLKPPMVPPVHPATARMPAIPAPHLNGATRTAPPKLGPPSIGPDPFATLLKAPIKDIFPNE